MKNIIIPLLLLTALGIIRAQSDSPIQTSFEKHELIKSNQTDSIEIFSKSQLVADTRELLEYLENIHPDPYYYSGGKVSFNRRFQSVLQDIPARGMTRDEYISLIRPFIATVGDAHTRISTTYEFDRSAPGGIPLSFGSVEQIIYVEGVAREKDKRLIGARLTAVENIPFEELMNRLKKIEGIENNYHGLMRLRSYLKIRPYLALLVPEWKDYSNISASFVLANGKKQDVMFDLPVTLPDQYITNGSKIKLPSTEKSDFAYGFLEDDHKTAILKIDQLEAYREMFESISGKRDITGDLTAIYERYNGEKAPDDFDMLMAGIPSVIDLFKELFEEMKRAGTENLVVDLSKNTGGNSLMSDILTYFLYGRIALAKIITEAPSVKKYSSYYFEMNPGKTIGQINKEYSSIQSYQLSENDYDFSTERYIEMVEKGRIDTLTGLRLKYRTTPTFLKEIEQGTYGKYYTPPNVLVASSNYTFSSAFTLLRYLANSGAKIAGSTSGQSGNGFGNLLYVTLKNTGIKLAISKDAYIVFPENRGERMVLDPDYKLTYDQIREYNFDINPEVRFAIELLFSKKR